MLILTERDGNYREGRITTKILIQKSENKNGHFFFSLKLYMFIVSLRLE